MEEGLVIALLAATDTACAVPVVRAMAPLRRQEDEAWYDYYLRLYWIPGSVLVIASVGVARVFGWGFEDLGLPVYFLGTCWAGSLAWMTLIRKRNRGY